MRQLVFDISGYGFSWCECVAKSDIEYPPSNAKGRARPVATEPKAQGRTLKQRFEEVGMSLYSAPRVLTCRQLAWKKESV